MSLLYAAYYQLDEDNSPFLDDLIEIDGLSDVNFNYPVEVLEELSGGALRRVGRSSSYFDLFLR